MAEFDQIFANDPNNPQSVAENGVVSIYAPGTRTLLSLRTVTGDPLSNPLRVNSRGFGPAFMVDGYTEVAWEAVAPGEVFSGTFKSYKGVLEEALAAKASARDAVTAVPLKIQEAVASGDFRGPAGKDGANVVPTAQAIAAELTTKGTAAEIALSAATAKAVAAQTLRRGVRFAHLGDSISTTVSGGGNTHWAWLAPFLLEGQLVHVLDAGVGGNTSAQILARVPDVIARGVRYCTVLAGTNDHNAATTITNLPLIYDALSNAGIEPIPVLMIPNNADAELLIIAQVNAFISNYAEQRGWLVLDANTPLADPLTGKLRAGLNFDAVHPNETGHLALGRSIAAQLADKLGGWKPALTNHAADRLNIGGEGVMVTKNATEVNKAAMWTTSFGTGPALAATVSLVPAVAADKIVGNWQRITLAAGNNGRYLFRKAVTLAESGAKVGDRLRLAFRLKAQGHEGNNSRYAVSLGFTGAAGTTIRHPIRSWSADVNGTMVDEFEVPVGTTGFLLEFSAESGVPISNAATVDIGAVTLRNMTRTYLNPNVPVFTDPPAEPNPGGPKAVNIIDNPRVGIDTIGWSASTGATSRVASGGPLPDAPTFHRVTYASTPTSAVQVRNGISGKNLVTAGKPYRFDVMVRPSWEGAMVQLTIGWYNGDTFITSSNGTLGPVAANTWGEVTASANAPANATRHQVTAIIQASGTLPPVGGTFDMTACMTYENAVGAAKAPYRDGASVGWTWLGAAHASPSGPV